MDPVVAAKALTKRQREIVELMGPCPTQAEVAEAIGISLNTLRSHLKVIYQKLHVHDRREAWKEHARIKRVTRQAVGDSRKVRVA